MGEEDGRARAEAAFQAQLAEAQDRFASRQALEELIRRLGGDRSDAPCPDCGSMEHFEC